MRVRECGRNVAQYSHYIGNGKFAGTRQSRPQGLTLHEGHGVVGKPVHLAGCENGHNEGVLQPRCEKDLLPEAFNRDSGRKVRREHLDYNVAPQRFLLGDKNARHPATAEFLLDGVVIAKCALQPLSEVAGHWFELLYLPL
jgi:hypothetical protein